MTPVDLKGVLLAALLNPVVAVVAFAMGWKADAWQKLPVAAFAAAMLGSVLLYLAVAWRVPGVAPLGRAAAGIFTAEFLCALVWAAAGYWRLGRRRP
jgi:hypothetical protein